MLALTLRPGIGWQGQVMNHPNDLYRQTKVAQKQAERGGFIGTASALAAIAEMLILETSVDAAVIAQFDPRGPASPIGPFPVFREARA